MGNHDGIIYFSMSEELRDGFEAWALSRGMHVVRYAVGDHLGVGDYQDDYTSEAWAAWQAAIAYIRQHRDLKLAGLVGALPHGEDCGADYCGRCGDGFHVGLPYSGHDYVRQECTCPRGELLAALGETA
jgi:hypothetical protein